MTSTIAFVGAGPTTIYALHALLGAAKGPFALTIFEEQATAGRGTPYRPGWNDPAMLSNIASIEIPPLENTLVEWLEAQPSDRLVKVGVDPADIGDRTFYPRLALGEFFQDQFEALLERAKSNDIDVTIRTRCTVTDAVSTESGMILKVRPRFGESFEQRFDHVVLATGHQWPAEPEARPGYFLSPWPASALAKIPSCKVGIRGSSLSAIDAAVAIALNHGEFVCGNDGLDYRCADDTNAFCMTMMSRKGLLPEADFFHPVPYEPLDICTAEAIEGLLAAEKGNLLDDAFALFKQELTKIDPDYAQSVGLEGSTLEAFCDRYFAERIDVDPFVWAEQNLAEAKRNYVDESTVPWRYAILRMHEIMALLVPHLEQAEFQRFSKTIKAVFVDDYATVPHESIERMIALHRAGKLEILAIGDEYRIDSHRPEGGAVLHVNGERHAFPAFVEATGQRALGVKDFPFQSLIGQGIVRDQTPPDPKKAPRGIVVDDEFHPVADNVPDDQLFCLSLPFLLGRHPFIQGITSSFEMGQVVGEALAKALGRNAEERTELDTDPEAAAA